MQGIVKTPPTMPAPCIFALQSSVRTVGEWTAIMHLWERIVDAVSSRKDYEDAVAAIEAAIHLGKLKPEDKAAQAINMLEARKTSRLHVAVLDGLDWVELSMLAEENSVDVVTVKDLISLFKLGARKQ